MINEKVRLSYLEAMGIRSWVPREQLPGAKPSIRLVPQGKQPAKERALEGASGLAAMRNAVGAKPKDASKAATSESVTASIDALHASLSMKPTTKTEQSAAPVVSSDRETPAEVAVEALREIPSLTLLGVDDVLMVVEQPTQNGVKGLQYPHRVLLNDALRILSPSFRCENVSEDEIDSRLIQQTLPHTPSNQDRWGHIQAILHGFIDVRTPKLVLCFGPDASELLSSSSLSIIEAAHLHTLFGDADLRLELANQLAEQALP